MSVYTEWKIGLEVNVAARTWPGINKPGGHGKIIKIHYSSLGVVDTLDVKYTLGNGVDTNLDTELVKPHVELSRGRRSRKGRDFLATQYEPAENPQRITPIEEKENLNPKKAKRAKNSDKKGPEDSTTNPTKKKKSKQQNIKIQSEDLPKKKRSKPNGNGASEKPKQKSTAPHSPVFNEDRLPEGLPKFVLTNPGSPHGALSPLGPVTNCDTPVRYPSVSEDRTSDAANRASAFPEERELTNEQVGKLVERKTLQNIFDDQMKEATHYIDRLVGGNNNKFPKQSSADDTKPAAMAPPAAAPLDEKRCAEFGKVFSKSIMYNDFIHEGKLFDKVNEMSSSFGCKAFTIEEMDQFVGRLIAEDKVMLSDGYFYPI